MGFIEELRQKEVAEALRKQHLVAQQQAQEKERFQREVAEQERRAQRRQQAEKFRGESGISEVVVELGKFLETQKRGHSYGLSYDNSYEPILKDPDSLIDTASWDEVYRGTSQIGYTYYRNYSRKCIAVETCPDGNIVFHGGLFGSTTIRVTEWRSNEKEQLFDKALKKAYKHPENYRYSRQEPPGIVGNG